MDTPCIPWTGAIDRKGYGRTTSSGRNGEPTLAHRAAYIAANGPVPVGLELDHLCRNPRCVNVEHLEAVTHAENVARAAAAQTHCKRGHEFTPENTYARRDGLGRRQCRACNRAAVAAYKSRRAA
jgi:hypothetical protein